MAAFVGCVGCPPHIEAQARSAFNGANGLSVTAASAEGAAFAGGQARHGRKPNTIFASEAHLDNRDELRDRLGLNKADVAALSDEGLLLALFERWGGRGIALALGRFAFAYWDADARRLTLGRDCLGEATLLFHRSGDRVIFSSRLASLLAMPDVPRAIDEKAVANFLVLNQRDIHRTAYRGIERVPARHLVIIGRDGIRHEPYWAPDFKAPPPYQRDEDYVARARDLFDLAVTTATGSAAEVAIPLSGGLDSSAIAATVARQNNVGRIVCYTSVPPPDASAPPRPAKYRDERAKVEALGAMYPQLTLAFRNWDAPHGFEDYPARYFTRALVPRLGGINLGMMGAMLDDLAPHRLALVGTKGNFGLSWTGEHSLLSLLRTGDWARFARELPLVARHGDRGIMRTIGRDVVRPAMPAAFRMWRKLRERNRFDIPLISAVNPDFVIQSGLAAEWATQGFDPYRAPPEIDPARVRAWRLFDASSIDRDNSGWVEETFGLRVRDPHADRRLLEFCLAVPEPLYRRNGVPRSFVRAVFADRLPREIVNEVRRGTNHLAWFATLNRQRARIAEELERIEASPLASCLLDIPRLKRLVAHWPKDENEAEPRHREYQALLPRALHVGNFIRWVEGGNR